MIYQRMLLKRLGLFSLILHQLVGPSLDINGSKKLQRYLTLAPITKPFSSALFLLPYLLEVMGSNLQEQHSYFPYNCILRKGTLSTMLNV